MTVILTVIMAIVWVSFLFFKMGRAAGGLRDLVQFNIQGANPIERLVPNINYTLLFLLLLSITMGGGDVFTTSHHAL